MPLAADVSDDSVVGVESTFAWRARDGDGTLCSGIMSAASASDVANRLRADGRYVVAIRESVTGMSEEAPVERRASKLNRDGSIAFFRQISVMLAAGVSISEALDAVVRQTSDATIRSLLVQIQDEVESGDSLSNVLARRPRSFSPAVVSLIRAAEATGSLDEMTRRAAEHLEKERRLVRQVRTALTYPAFMAGAGAVIILALLVFVLPRFAAIYESRAASLPMPTKILLATAGFLRDEWWWYLPLLALLFVLGMAWGRTEGARRQLDSILLRTPVVRDVILGAMVNRWTRTLAVLCGAGVNLVDAVSIIRGSSRSPTQRDLWNEVEHAIRDGRPLASALEDSVLVPPSVAAMVSAGERSGRLPEVLETIADCAEEDLETTVVRTTSLIEPVMIVVLGLFVGLIALAMLLPVFGMSRVVTG